jgi:hypothetical protein
MITALNKQRNMISSRTYILYTLNALEEIPFIKLPVLSSIPLWADTSADCVKVWVSRQAEADLVAG